MAFLDRWVVLVLVALLAPPSFSLAAEADPGHAENAAADQNSQYHRNHFAGIVGWSHKDTGKDSVTLGMEYTRVFTRHIGVSAYLELSEGQFQADTVGLTATGYPTKHLALFAGPGLERSLFEEKEYLLRTGLAYAFRPEGIGVAPMAWVDFVGGRKIYFLGVGIGKGF